MMMMHAFSPRNSTDNRFCLFVGLVFWGFFANHLSSSQKLCLFVCLVFVCLFIIQLAIVVTDCLFVCRLFVTHHLIASLFMFLFGCLFVTHKNSLNQQMWWVIYEYIPNLFVCLVLPTSSHEINSLCLFVDLLPTTPLHLPTVFVYLFANPITATDSFVCLLLFVCLLVYWPQQFKKPIGNLFVLLICLLSTTSLHQQMWLTNPQQANWQ